MEELQSTSTMSDDRSEQTAESLRALRDEADQTLNRHRERVCEIETRLHEQLQRIANELAQERQADQESLCTAAEQSEMLQRMQAVVAEKEAEIEAVLDALAEQSLVFESQIAERDEELEQVLSLGEKESHERETLEEELEAMRQALQELQSQECDRCAQYQSEVEEKQQKYTELSEQSASLEEQLQTRQSELEKTAQSLRDAEELHQANEQEHEQTRRKFELALADVHKLKRENAELHEELLSRPEADAQESPELVSLRAERDALAQRVSELENAPPQQQDAEVQQELDDLQRRFELAVDEVRQLKQSKADLTEQLAAATSGSTAVSETGALDWQAQKAQLLAALNAEDEEEIAASRVEERATIEGTISITDRVVAKKDAQLSECEAEILALRNQLETGSAGPVSEDLREKLTAEILDSLVSDDEMIQAERAKLQQQQEQLQEKLREAELEISVQRATLAREQASLEEKLSQISVSSSDEPTADGKPRRRWLSALGIGDEPDEES